MVASLALPVLVLGACLATAIVLLVPSPPPSPSR
jgi:hypothetical protein